MSCYQFELERNILGRWERENKLWKFYEFHQFGVYRITSENSQLIKNRYLVLDENHIQLFEDGETLYTATVTIIGDTLVWSVAGKEELFKKVEK